MPCPYDRSLPSRWCGLGLKARWLTVWRGRSSDLTRPHSCWRRNCTEEAQSALYVSAVPATHPPSSGHGWRWPLRPARCRRAASSRAAVARSVPERPERAFKSAIQIPISESCLALGVLRLSTSESKVHQHPACTKRRNETQFRSATFASLRFPLVRRQPPDSPVAHQSPGRLVQIPNPGSAVQLVAHEG